MKKSKHLKALRLIFLSMLLAFTTGNIFAQGGVIVQPGTDVTVESGTTLDITDGDLLLRDDLNNAPSFLQEGTLHFTNSGDAKVEQYLTKDVWHSVSSPVSNEVNGAYMWIYFMEWLEPSNSWNYMNQPTNLALNAGQGYFAWAYTTDPNSTWPASPDSVVLNGTLNFQDVNLTLSVTDASSKSGYNLVGNPFPCGLNWNGDASWNLTNLDASMWVWDAAAGNYKVWNFNSGGTLNSGEIAATQGFWVHADDTTGATATSMTLPASQRVHSTEPFYKSSGPINPYQLKLKVQGNGLKNDEIIIGFMEGATPQPNSMLDATYMSGDEDAPSLYSVLFSKNYAMKQLPGWEEYESIPLNFRAGTPGNYTISASWIESFPDDLPIYLEDKKENFFHDLRLQPLYDFIAEPNDNNNRFMVHFTNALGIDNPVVMQQVNIYAWQKTVYINIPINSFNDGYCIIYNMTGQKVTECKVAEGLNTISHPFTPGHYVVTVNTRNGEMITDKVFIK